MKEHEDDVLPTVKESTTTVDSTTADETVTMRGKIEGLFGERDEGEDMVVDVVGADVVVDDRGGTRADLEGKVGINGLMEEGSKREIQSSDMDVDQVDVVEEVRVVTLEKVEVVVNDEGVKTSVEVSKEVIQENVVTTAVSALDCDAQKSSEEPETGGGETTLRDNNRDSTKEIVDKATGKESDVSNSLNFPESFTTTGHPGSRDAHVAAVKEGLFGKDEGEDGVDSQVSSTEAVNAGTSAANSHVSPKILEQQSGDDETRKDILQPTIEVATNDVQDSGNGTQAGDSNAALQSLGREAQLAGGEGEVERGLAVETVEQGMESAQEVADKFLDSTKIQDSATKVDGLVVEEGLAGKGEAQDGVSKDPSLESTDIPNVQEGLTEKQATESVQEVADVDSTKIPESVSNVDKMIVEDVLDGKDKAQDVILSGGVDANTGEGSVHENAGILDQKSEVQMSKVETSHSTTEVRIDNDQKSGIDTTDKQEEPERGVEQPMSSIQEVADKDHVMDEKTEKEVEVLELSKVQESSTMVVDMVVDQKTEVDPTPKDESLHTTIEVMTAEASHKSLNVANEVTTAQNLPNPEVQVSSVGGILVENQILNVDTEMKVSSQTSVETFEEVNHATSHADYGEDAGMDIDEVLGWKDEIPGIDSLHGQEKDQDFKIHTDPEANFEHGLSKPLVYERRVQVNDDVEEHTDFCRQQETETPEVEQSTLTDDVSNETSVSFHQSCYFHPPENEGEFSASDLVWGKVRSHPWWPGQIFDPSDASDKAMKYHKKDRFLVGYFGDRTFAWNDSTVLKPFRAKFSQIEKQTNSEAFNNALHCALEEVSRRVELGLACSCTPQDIYKKIECQIVENAGIKKESSKRHGMDKTALVTSFEPDKLIDYVRLLAKSPYDENDKMDLVMAKAQLLSCARYKGYRQLSEFQFCGTLLEDSSGLTQGVDQVIKKERIFSDLKVDPTYYPGNSEEGSRKRKASDSNSNSNSNSDVSVPEKRPTLETVTPSPKPSFKVGELIQRVANQLSDKSIEPVDQTVGLSHSVQTPVNMVNPQANLPEMLSQLQLTAQDPMKGVNNETRKRKPSNENDPEDFEFDDVNDSYWTDRIIQNHPEDLQLQPAVVVHDNNQNGGVEHPHQIVAYEEKQKPVKQSRRSNKKRFFSSNHEIEAKEQSELIERRRLNLATEVLMKFTEGIYFPSEIHLNKMFRRFGPLMESETEVDRQSGRARVVFKKCSDAEVAHSSAGKFNIFGSIVPLMHASNGEIMGSSSKWMGVTDSGDDVQDMDVSYLEK
ncbi:unnamed protein product [Lactuca saligna]|uniref:PWWP domain-containing protein n=1 Tax=Lactuca saligna TaxID=75948 RepID=A0AA36EGV1_LACSI|nr:unnamed protein product [Lactuca saligna]